MKLDLFKRELSLILRKSGVVRYVVLFAVLGLSVTPSGFANDKTRNSKHPEQQDNVQVSPSAVQQAPTKRVTGKIVDEHDAPIAGATIVVVGTTRGVISDNDGTFNIDVRPQEMLKFSFVGYNDQILEVGDRATINVKMALKTEELEDVTVVAFAKQKKESVLASIETVRPSDLRVPSSNLTTALGGKLAGVISYQRSGEPGQDNAEFFIRGVTTFGYARDPLILIDGIELSKNDLARLHPDDIASFSIMKDATATALYGARGANGVILVTTKGGKEGKTTVSVRFESSLSEPTSKVEIADPITYMRLHNEAVRTRDPLNPLPYSPEKIEQTILGANPYAYPMTDWYSSLMKDYTFNHRLNFNISGGGKIARYYLSGSVTQDNGNLKVDQKNDFNSNIDLKKYLIRSNVELDLTPTTVAMVRVHGTFDDYRGPIYGGTDMYRNIMRSNPVLFPAYFQPDKANEYTNHILFGNFGNANYINPYAEMVKGYKDRSYSLMLAQIELKQDLNFITEGLSARVLGNTTRVAEFAVRRNYNPYYYEIDSFDRKTGQYVLKPLNAETGTEYLNYSEDPKTVTSTFYNENILQYDRTFDDKHAVSGLLVGIVRQFLSGNAGNLQASLPQRNLGLSGRFTYAYDNRYFTEFDFGYNGTERFAAQERFGFFPAFSVGYIISNEAFWEPWKKTISKLKFKGSYGLVGNDQIGDVNDRFFYLSNVNLNDGGRGYTWGTDGDYYRPGVSISRYANDKITWETAVKSNVGFELGLFNEIEIIAEYFREYRRNILMDRLSMATFGLQAPTRANLGEASSQGVDASVDIQHNFTKEWWLTSRINFTYARGVFEKFEEPDFSETPWRSRIGYPITQQWGYIAERLFVDDQEVRNSPVQDFGSIVRGGDIKYHDINGDDKINELDLVPIGYPTTPEINYGFGASTGFKGVDFSFFFQGSARSSFWIDTWATSPFYNYHYNGEDSNLASKYANNALLKAYANSHWSETNRDVYALWPRLSETIEANNVQRNTWFMQDGGFLRLKSAEVGYTLPASFTKPMKVASARIYLSGTNLMVWSKFKLWDPEMAGNGLNYPVQRVFNAGINIDF